MGINPVLTPYGRSQAGPELTQAQLEAYHRQLADHQANQAGIAPSHQEQASSGTLELRLVFMQAMQIAFSVGLYRGGCQIKERLTGQPFCGGQHCWNQSAPLLC